VTTPVVVGVDGVEHSAQAITLAAREAELRGAPLLAAHAYHWIPPVTTGIMPGGDTPEGAVRDAATDLLAATVKQIHADHPDLDVHSYAMSGPAGVCLADLARPAALLVVGGRGRGGFPGLTLGSVALSAVARASCPVLVARGEARPATGRVVVGVDIGTPASGPRLLDFAFAEAALRGAGLEALHAWEDPGNLYPVALSQYTAEQIKALNGERRHLLDAVLAPSRDKHREVEVTTRVVTGSPVGRLVDASRQADLLIIGGRLHPDQEGMRLGGLAHAVLHHAQCPVVVVPED
jgi:nucleotide-binding universal stress UspA family protein